MTQTVVLGPYYWTTAESTRAMQPGQIHYWSFPILTPAPSAQQKLQALTVTAVPMQDTVVQSLAVTDVSVVAEPNYQLTVNFTVTNKHPTSSCLGYKVWAVMVVP